MCVGKRLALSPSTHKSYTFAPSTASSTSFFMVLWTISPAALQAYQTEFGVNIAQLRSSTRAQNNNTLYFVRSSAVTPVIGLAAGFSVASLIVFLGADVGFSSENYTIAKQPRRLPNLAGFLKRRSDHNASVVHVMLKYTGKTKTSKLPRRSCDCLNLSLVDDELPPHNVSHPIQLLSAGHELVHNVFVRPT